MTHLPFRVVAQLVCLLALVLVMVALTVQDDDSPATSPAPVPLATIPTIQLPPSSPEPDPQIAVREAEERVRQRLDGIARGTHFAVSLRDQATRTRFDYGPDRFFTASLVKVHLSALMSWRAEQGRAGLTAAERQDIEAMITRSDNDAALRAYFALGGRPGIEQGLQEAWGLTGIQIGDRGLWGRSSTRPRAVVALLDRVMDDRSGSYALLQDTMSRVVPDQRWGVSALADPGSTVQLKVGWVQNPEGWVVNSSGQVVVDGAPVLISIMTDRNVGLEAGIAAIEKIARVVGDVVRAQREARREEARQREAQQRGLPLSPLLRRNSRQVG